MKKKIWIAVLTVVVLGGLYVWSSYNGLVSGGVAIDGAWAQVETQYQRRFDLIPNLVNSVKGILKQEQTIFTALAEARTHYSGAVTIDQKAAAATQVESALGRLLAVVENYPQLKSVDTVQTLMAQLEGTENRVAVERKRFNDAVQAYNLRVKRVPSALVARLFGFSERAYFEAASGAEKAPSVNL